MGAATRPTPSGQALVDAAVGLPDGRLDRRNAALYLGRSPKTLAQWARCRVEARHRTRTRSAVGSSITWTTWYYLDDLDTCKAGGGEHPADASEAEPALHGAANPASRGSPAPGPAVSTMTELLE